MSVPPVCWCIEHLGMEEQGITIAQALRSREVIVSFKNEYGTAA